MLFCASFEILVTREAMEMIPAEAGIMAREINIFISGVSIPAYVVQYREAQPPWKQFNRKKTGGSTEKQIEWNKRLPILEGSLLFIT